MKILPHLMIAAVVVSSGYVAGRLARGKTDGELPATERSTAKAERRPTPERAKVLKQDIHDLAGLHARFEARSKGQGDVARELERLPVPALKELALEQFAAAKTQLPRDEMMARQSVIRAILSELYRREGTAAIEWAITLEDEGTRKSAFREILLAGVSQSPATALPWAAKYYETYGQDMTMRNTLAMRAMARAAELGADEVIRVHQTAPQDMRGNPLSNVRFPDDFDFAKLHAALAGKIDMADAFCQWSSRDKDAAWQGVKSDIESRGQPGGRYFGSLVLGAVAKHGEPEALRWAAEQVAELPLDQRKFCLQNLDNQGKLTTEGISTLAADLGTEDRIVFAQGMFRSSGGAAKALAALEALPREDMISLLQNHTSGLNKLRAQGIDPASLGGSAYSIIKEAPIRFGFTPEEMARVNGTTHSAP